MHRILAFAMAAVLAAAAPALGQSATPTSSINVDLDPGPVGIPLGNTHEFAFQVTLKLANIVCNQAATATVTLSVRDLPSPLNGVQGTVPASLAFAVPAGNYVSGVPGLSPYEDTLDAILSINVTAEALANHAHTFNVTAVFAGTLAGCQAASAIPRAEGSGEHQIRTGPASDDGTQARGATTTSTTGSNGGGGKGAPGLQLPIVALVMLGLAIAARRKTR